MKSSLFVVVLSFSVLVANADPKVDISSLPQPVQRAINEHKGQGEVKKVKTVRVDGQVAYEVEYKEGGDEKKVVLGQNGLPLQGELNRSQGKGKGKGKGKAKGHDKWDKDRDSDEDRKSNDNTAVATPKPAEQPQAAKPSPAPAVHAPVATAPAAKSPTAKVSDDVGALTSRMNRLDNTEAAAKVAMSSLMRETGLSAAALRSQNKQYPVGSGGLLVCHAMAKSTGKPVATFLKARTEGRDWASVAAANNFDLSTVVPRLQRLMAEMETAYERSRKTR